MAKAIDRGGIDPINPDFERASNRSDGVAVILWSPPVCPVIAADSPRAETDGRDLKICVSKAPSLPDHNYIRASSSLVLSLRATSGVKVSFDLLYLDSYVP